MRGDSSAFPQPPERPSLLLQICSRDRESPRRAAWLRTVARLTAGACLGGCASRPETVTTSSGLVYSVIERGTGPQARAGDWVSIHETTRFSDGTVLYSTRDRDRPLRFLLGGKRVIDGVDQGVTGMRVGERRHLIVPPTLSRRSTYPVGLSPGDTLYYDLELVRIENGQSALPPDTHRALTTVWARQPGIRKGGRATWPGGRLGLGVGGWGLGETLSWGVLMRRWSRNPP